MRGFGGELLSYSGRNARNEEASCNLEFDKIGEGRNVKRPKTGSTLNRPQY